MKRLISILLAIVICLALFACADKSSTETTPTNSGDAQTADSPQTNSGNAQTSDSSTSPVAQTGTLTGYIDDAVDHFARPTYQIAFVSTVFQFLQQAWYAAMQEFEPVLNIKVTSVSAENDSDAYLSNLELLKSRGFDGAIVDCTPAYQVRATEILEDSGIPYLAFVNTILDDNGKTVCPNVILDQYKAGVKIMEWLLANFENEEYFGKIDITKLGAIEIGYSTNVDLNARSEGAADTFKAMYPDNPHFFTDATTAGGLTPDAAYAIVSATVSAHPEIEYWFVSGCTEFFGPGAARAFDDLGKESVAMVCTFGHGPNVVDWESMTPDTVSANVACLMVPDLLYSVPAVAGIVALIDGRATKETLWLEKTPENYKYGNDYGVWEVENRVVTRWNYQDYIDETQKLMFG